MISRIKGTQDFLDLSLFNFIISSFKKTMKTYHFEEISTPILESTDLFKRVLGEYTDVVTKEMFVIEPRNKDDDERICLRPEATASTVRAFLEGNIQLLPWKVFTYGPMFRYERPQKGRYRQFHQINVEAIGSASISEDVQLIKMLDRFFHEVLNLNNYALTLNFLGCLKDRKVYLEKLSAFLNSAKASEICATCQVRKEHNMMRIFDCKNKTCAQIYQSAPFIADHLCSGCDAEWQELRESLSLLSVTFAYRPTLVRGLDYYNKTAFEFVSDNLGAQNAFCGGGRYDKLATQLGSKQEYPAIGAAMGIERLILLLEPMRDQLKIEQAPPLHIIIPMDKKQHQLALLIADTLQAHNICTDVLTEGSIKSMMRKANKMGATYTLVVGDEEQQNKSVMAKNMITGEQEAVAQIDLVEYLQK